VGRTIAVTAALQIDRVLSQSFLPERFRDYAFGGAALHLGALSCDERPKIISPATTGQSGGGQSRTIS